MRKVLRLKPEYLRVDREAVRKMVARNLTDARLAARMTQLEVANLFDPPLNRTAVVQWESGDTLPDLERLATCARAYGVSLHWLVFGIEAANVPEFTDEARRVALIFSALPEEAQAALRQIVAALAEQKRGRGARPL